VSEFRAFGQREESDAIPFVQAILGDLAKKVKIPVKLRPVEKREKSKRGLDSGNG